MNRIREVWANNLDQEMAALRDAVDQYPYVFFKAEYPGTVARPIGNFKTNNDVQYQTMRCNTELLRVIQIGITLADAEGNPAPDPGIWQFNFQFDLEEDMYTPDAVDVLRHANTDFARHQELGINPNDFAELLITSGLVLYDDLTWVAFECQNDMGYLLKILTGAPLPTSEADFKDLLAIWFPKLYDLKYVMKTTRPIKVRLQELADEFGVARIAAPPAAAEVHLIEGVFYKTRNSFFGGKDPDETKFNGHLLAASDAGFTPTNNPGGANSHMGHQTTLHNQYGTPMYLYR
ncbi:hypothetical protein FRC04_003327 [Tulasnella sp. 424]|nr:hypothetical protein FRC04_003327 [Tulasnella sp. 424]